MNANIILSIEYPDGYKVTSIGSDSIEFSNGWELRGCHDQDCCEAVYADFTQLEDTTISDVMFHILTIEKVEGKGVRINGFFVPCYNQQNGYYSDNLSLSVKVELDISDCHTWEDR